MGERGNAQQARSADERGGPQRSPRTHPIGENAGVNRRQRWDHVEGCDGQPECRLREAQLGADVSPESADQERRDGGAGQRQNAGDERT